MTTAVNASIERPHREVIRHGKQMLEDGKSTHKQVTKIYTEAGEDTEVKTTRVYRHLLRAPFRSYSRLKLDICVSIPHELHIADPWTMEYTPWLAYPRLKIHEFNRDNELNIPLTKVDNWRDGISRPRNSDRTTELSRGFRFPVDRGSIIFWDSDKKYVNFITETPGRSWNAPSSARMVRRALEEGDHSRAMQHAPISAGFTENDAVDSDLAVYSKAREILDHFETELWTKYSLPGSYRFERLDINLKRTYWEARKDDGSYVYDAPVDALDACLSATRGWEPPKLTWVFGYDPTTSGKAHQSDLDSAGAERPPASAASTSE